MGAAVDENYDASSKSNPKSSSTGSTAEEIGSSDWRKKRATKPPVERPLRNSRVLMGIFSSDNMFDATHRRWHRNLFNNIWKDDRVCTLSQFLEGNLEDGKESKATVHATRRRDAPIEACELIYTFVTGSNLDPDGPTELLDDSGKKLPIETPGGRK